MPVSDHHLVDIDGLVTAAELSATVDAIAEWQLPSGMVQWFPGGHADPWNLTASLLALLLGAYRAPAERGSACIATLQRDDEALRHDYPD